MRLDKPTHRQKEERPRAIILIYTLAAIFWLSNHSCLILKQDSPLERVCLLLMPRPLVPGLH